FVRDVSSRKKAQSYLAAHYAATCILAEAESLAQAAPQILRAVCDNLNLEAGSLWQIDPSAKGLRCVESYEDSAAGVPRMAGLDEPSAFPQGRGLLSQVRATGQAVWFEELDGKGSTPGE